MKRQISIIGIIIGIILVICLIPLISNQSSSNSISKSHNKVVIFAPHPDDETIGMGGLIQRLKNEGKEVKVVLMCSGNGISDTDSLCYNYYELDIPANASRVDKKKIIREDSFRRVMGIYNVSYEMIGLDDSGTTDENVFSVMDRMCKEGYGEFYTTTEEYNIDHLHCANALKLMMEKYPQLKYRQYPVYWHASKNGTERFKPVPIINNYTDYNVADYLLLKLKALQIYNNIQIFPVGLYQTNIERIYYLN